MMRASTVQNSQADDRRGIVRRVRTDDMDELAAAQQDKNRRYLQLGSGRFRGDLLDLRLAGVQVFRERLNVGMRVEAAPSPDLVPVAIVTSGRGAMRFCGTALQPGALVQATGGQWDVRFERGIDYVSCVFRRESFERAGFDLRGRPIDPAWFRSTVRSVDPAAVARLSGGMRRVLSGRAVPPMQQPDAAARLIEAELLELTIAALTSAEDRVQVEPAWLRRRAVKRALEYLDGDPQPWPTIAELCREAGVSQRTLEYGFRDLLGVTPVRYLKLLRLNRVRQRLSKRTSERETVTSMAVRFGFGDLGHFAVEYRQLFGERPSDTLRRS